MSKTMRPQLRFAEEYAKKVEEHIEETRVFYRWLKDLVKKFNKEEKQFFASFDNLDEWYKEAIAAALRGDALIDVIEEYLDRADPTPINQQETE